MHRPLKYGSINRYLSHPLISFSSSTFPKFHIILLRPQSRSSSDDSSPQGDPSYLSAMFSSRPLPALPCRRRIIGEMMDNRHLSILWRNPDTPTQRPPNNATRRARGTATRRANPIKNMTRSPQRPEKKSPSRLTRALTRYPASKQPRFCEPKEESVMQKMRYARGWHSSSHAG